MTEASDKLRAAVLATQAQTQQRNAEAAANDGPSSPSGNDDALAFADDFFGDEPRQLLAVKKGSGQMPARTFDIADRDGQRKFIAEHQAAGRDIYFPPNPHKTRLDKKGSKGDVAEARWLWIDLDPRKKEPLDAERPKMLALLTTELPAGIPKPNRVIDSGRGYWGFWKLATPQPVDGMDGALTAAIESYGRGIERAFGDRFADGCRNMDRIARLPGTVNQKTGQMARVLTEFSHDEPHAIENFPRAAGNTTAVKPGKSAARGAPALSGQFERMDPNDQRLSKLEPKWRVIGFTGDQENTYGGDRSKALFAFATQAVRAKIADDVIASCIMDTDWKIGECVREKKNVKRELDRVIERAHKFAVDEDEAAFNEKYAVVNMKGKTRVMTQAPSPIYPDRWVPQFSSFDDFQNLHSNKFKEIVIDGDTKRVPLGGWWLRNPQRRQYNGGLRYVPECNKAEIESADGSLTLNLWNGFIVAPSKGDCSLFLKHMRDNICSGDEANYQYLLNVMADAIQNRGQPGGVAVCLRGGKGTGKGFFIRTFGRLFGQHFLHVVNPEHLTGKFNDHLETVSVLFADECFWAGNRQHEQILKGLITEPTIVIEPKGFGVYEVLNHLHIFMASNSDWIVPASHDERRYFVLDVGAGQQQNPAYFAAIQKQMDDGGNEALLELLMNLDLKDFDIRKVPKTDALRHQQAQSRRGVDSLVEEMLHAGRVPFSHSAKPNVCITNDWEEEVRDSENHIRIRTHKGFDDFIRTKAPQELRYLGPTKVKSELTKKYKTAHFKSRINGVSVCGFTVPALADWRQQFVEIHGPIEWQNADATEWEVDDDDAIPF